MIRKHVDVVLCFFLVSIIVFNIFFIDNIIKNTIIKLSEKIVGAEVNIEDVDIRFSPFQFVIKGIEVTNPKDPNKNMYSIKLLEFDIDILELLSNRLIINHISVKDFLKDSIRSYPGNVYFESDFITSLDYENEANPPKNKKISILSNVVDTKYENMSYHTELKYRDLQNQLNENVKKIKQLLINNNLENEYQRILTNINKVSNIQINNLSTLKSTFEQINQIQTQINELNDKLQFSNEKIDSLNATTLKFSKELRSASILDEKEVIKLSTDHHTKHINIANLLFSNVFHNIFSKFKHYHHVMQNIFMHINIGTKPVINKTFMGKTVSFKSSNALPLIWIRKISIITIKENGINLTINNLTSNNELINSNTVLSLSIMNPKYPIKQFNMRGVLNNNEKNYFLSNNISFTSKIDDKLLFDNGENAILLEDSFLKLDLNLKLISKDTITGNITARLYGDNFLVKNENNDHLFKKIKSLLDSSQLPQKVFVMDLYGDMKSPEVNIHSSIDYSFKEMLSKYLNSKIDNEISYQKKYISKLEKKFNKSLNKKLKLDQKELIFLRDNQEIKINQLNKLLSSKKLAIENNAKNAALESLPKNLKSLFN